MRRCARPSAAPQDGGLGGAGARRRGRSERRALLPAATAWQAPPPSVLQNGRYRTELCFPGPAARLLVSVLGVRLAAALVVEGELPCAGVLRALSKGEEGTTGGASDSLVAKRLHRED